MLAPRGTARGLLAVTLVLALASLAACSERIGLPVPPPGEADPEAPGGEDAGGQGGGASEGADRRRPRPSGSPGDRPPAGTGGEGGGQPGGVAPATGAPGSFARALLGPGTGGLVVEVLAQQGAAPRNATLAHVTAVLRDVSGKEVSIASRAVPGGGQTWTAAAVREAAQRHGSARQGGGQVVIRLLFLNGRFADEGALGVAVQGDVAAVFPEQVERAGSLLTGAGAVEDAVTMHEVGHLLGLVDLVLSTGRADPEHPGHSPSRSSVMYWAVESTLIADVLTGGPPRDFDDRDRADLAAIRRGA